MSYPIQDSSHNAQNDFSSPTFALVAGEASGDTLGADLIRQLKTDYPNAQFVGIGGPKMQGEGLVSWYPMEKLSVMGLFEVLKHLPELLKLRKELIQRLSQLKPDVFIGIDAPDFNFTVERQLKAAGIPAVHYVGPSVWAWREKRLEKIKKSVDGVLVLFPFEPPIYHKYGIPVQYVGHPLANQVPENPDKNRARRQLNLSEAGQYTGILPGSRMSEIDKMADVYIQAAVKLKEIYPDMHFLVPCVHERAKARVQQAVDQYAPDLSISLILQQAQTVMEASDQLIVTSGTATLEAALMQRPMVLSIKVHPISYWIMKRLATTQWIGLPNILAQQTLVPELIQDQATPERIALELGRLVADKKLRERQLSAFKRQAEQLRQPSAKLAVQAIRQWAKLPEQSDQSA
jgi:lipid-A-disaccharide synthase